MKIYSIVLIPFLLFIYMGISIKSNEISDLKQQDKTTNIQSLNLTTYERIKAKYDTLIPIFDGLFITYHQIDTISYLKFSEKITTYYLMAAYSEDLITINTKKWGVIDSTGKVIVPFICDGVKEIADNKGVVSVYLASYSLNTGIPRYQYFGNAYLFTKAGLLKDTKKEFNLKIEYMADYHNLQFVIHQGPAFYLPSEYKKLISIRKANR